MVIKFFGLFMLGALLTGAVLIPRNQKAATTIHASVETQDVLPEIPANAPDNPTELGAVHWQRDLATGKSLSESSGKPLLILLLTAHSKNVHNTLLFYLRVRDDF